MLPVTVVISLSLVVTVVGQELPLLQETPFDDIQPVNYDNYTVFRVWSSDSTFLLQDGFHGGLILLDPDSRSPAYEILVAPQNTVGFVTDIKSRNWSYQVLDSNIQNRINEEQKQNSYHTRDGQPYTWDRYHSYEETNAWMKELPNQYPDVVTLYNIGKSHQKRDTYAVKLYRGRANNPAVFIEAGVHAREWIAPATSTWIFNHLLTSEDPEVRRLSTEYDWYIVPLTNPDGYVQTSKNRMWRKNMRRNRLCSGVDVNRNWGYHWNEAGSSSFECSDLYAGPKAMSEVETRNLDNFMKTIADQVKLYLSFHSYSQLLLWPEGHTSTRIPEFDDYEKIGKATMDAIAERYGTKYTGGSINEAIYAASGSTIDYMRATYKIPLGFCFELRPSRDDQGAGFILEPSQIIPTGEETFDGIGAMIREGQALGYFKV